MSASEKNRTQSLDYVIRSGIAGGIAGCMVMRVFMCISKNMTDILLGKDKCSTSR